MFLKHVSQKINFEINAYTRYQQFQYFLPISTVFTILCLSNYCLKLNQIKIFYVFKVNFNSQSKQYYLKYLKTEID